MRRALRHILKIDLAGRICIDSVTLDRQARYRRRIAMSSDRGHAFLLDLPKATYLAHGDALELDNGSLIRVQAAAEDLLQIHAHDAAALARIAWHIGNRHTPCEVTAKALYIQPDHVLAEMIEGLGGHVHAVRRPFEPEGGAYGGHGALAKGHLHGGHAHGVAHDHSPGNDHSHAHEPRLASLHGTVVSSGHVWTANGEGESS